MGDNSMRREVSFDDISDGKLYTANDLVKADCNGCEGCSKCCTGMGSSIVLDPLDVYELTTNLQVTFDELVNYSLELNIVDGVILPNIKMTGKKGRCSFLSDTGRCTVHEFRPGICRLFPLGRIYEDGSFRYFLQVNECPKENKTKVKVKKWIDVVNIHENEEYINSWHYFLKDLEQAIENSDNPERVKQISMYVLQQFYVKSYDEFKDFYVQFKERLAEGRAALLGR